MEEATPMTMAHFQITPLHPSLGAEIAGVDLSAPIDEPTGHALTRALADHLALVFRGQSLTPVQRAQPMSMQRRIRLPPCPS